MRLKFCIILVTIQVLGYDSKRCELELSDLLPKPPASEMPPLKPLPSKPPALKKSMAKPLLPKPSPLPPAINTLPPASTTSLPASTTLPPDTITLPPASITLPPASTTLPPAPTTLPRLPIRNRPEKEPHTWFKDPVNQMTVDVLDVLESYKAAEKDEGNMTDGIVASQLSTLFPLGVLSLFVEGNSRTQLEQWLRCTRDDIDNYLPSFLDEIRSSQIGKIDLQVLNEVFIQKDMNVTDRFVDISSGKFGNDHAYVDFVDQEAAADSMNSFISLSTEKKVSSVVLPQHITPGSQLIIVNVILFKNIWKTEFNRSLSSKSVFWRDTGTYKLVPSMTKTETMLYVASQELHAEVLTMLLDNEDFDFVIISPFEEERIGAVQRTLNILQNHSHILDDVEKQQKMTLVELTMPSFKLHSKIDLKKVLNQLGVSQLFDEKLANIKGIFKEPQERPAFVSNLYQEAVVHIDEEGVMADGDERIDDANILRSKETQVVVNIHRPFIFMIRFRGVTMFMGAFDGLEQDSL